MASVVMLVSNRYDPDERVQKEAEALVSDGHEVTVLAFDREDSQLPDSEMIAGVHVQRLTPRKSTYGGLIGVWRGLRAFHRACHSEIGNIRPDIIHCHDMDTCAVGKKWKKHGIKFVFDAHDQYWSWMLMPNPRSLLRKIAARILEKREQTYARLADLLITVTEGTGENMTGLAERYRKLGCNPVVIWNAPRETPDPLPSLPKCPTIGYIGNVREPQMFDWLIAAFAEIPPEKRPKLKVAGSGRAKDVVHEKLLRASEEIGFELELSDRYSASEQAELFDQTSIQWAVYPLDRGNMAQGMPVKLLETIARGRPVITNADSLMGEHVSANQWGKTVVEGDAVQAASAIQDLIGMVEENDGPFEFQNIMVWPDQAKILKEKYRQLAA